MGKPIKFKIVFGNERLITPTGLSLVGQILSGSKLAERANRLKLDTRPKPHIKNSDVLLTYIGMLCQGKTDFECVREMFDDPEYYELALGLSRSLPSEATLRQRMDGIGRKLRQQILISNVAMFTGFGIVPTANRQGYTPLDVDVSPFDNSGTKKGGVSRTYAGYDGYAPIFAYLGTEGYLVDAELRTGKTHCQNGTATFLKETIRMSRQITRGKLLLRMDAGNDATVNIGECIDGGCDYLIKRNHRRETPDFWQFASLYSGCTNITHPREGKTVYIGSVIRDIDVPHGEETRKERVRIVYEITERTIDKHGQMMLMPEREVNTWWTSLQLSDEEVIALYHAHSECEQFHSEIKTDMDVERLPSGKFDTNALVLELAILAYNILRMLGQETLKKKDTPLKRPVKRRRLRTVIQNLMLIAGRITTHARQLILSVGKSNAWRHAFARLYARFAYI